MSWEETGCPTCFRPMDRLTAAEIDGVIHMTFRCPHDGTEAEVDEPEQGSRSRREAMANRKAES